MAEKVSNEELENARHEVEFCYRQFNDLFPTAVQIHEGRIQAETLADNLVNIIQSNQWNVQFRDLLIKTMGAQGKYIRILEKRIGA